jgi:hypothetical protein
MTLTVLEFDELDADSQESYIEENEVFGQEVVDSVFDTGDAIIIRTLIQKTESIDIIKRAILLDEEVVNIALLNHPNVTKKQKDIILTESPYLRSECSW